MLSVIMYPLIYLYPIGLSSQGGPNPNPNPKIFLNQAGQ